jgi:hypothetical protein
MSVQSVQNVQQLPPHPSHAWMADWCPKCNPDGMYADRPVRLASLTAPTSVYYNGGKYLTCHYRCPRPRCGHRWSSDDWPATCVGIDPKQRKKAA